MSRATQDAALALAMRIANPVPLDKRPKHRDEGRQVWYGRTENPKHRAETGEFEPV